MLKQKRSNYHLLHSFTSLEQESFTLIENLRRTNISVDRVYPQDHLKNLIVRHVR